MSTLVGPGPVRTMLVDDDPMVLGHLRSILTADGSVTIVAEAHDVPSAVRAVFEHRPTVVLLDIRMPGTDGVSGLPDLLRAAPELHVAMLTTFHDEEYVRGAIAHGAHGFLLKTDAPADLLRAVPALAAGGAVFSPRVARWLVREEAVDRHGRAAEAQRTVDSLSARQREMLAQLATGASNHQISRRMSLTEGTVKQYLSVLFAQIGTENRVQAAVLAHRAGLSG